jgi:hypothetical protein
MAPELGPDGKLHFWSLEKNVRCFIGIEEFRCWKQLTQTFAKCGFSRGNSSGDSNGRHSNEEQRPQCF